MSSEVFCFNTIEGAHRDIQTRTLAIARSCDNTRPQRHRLGPRLRCAHTSCRSDQAGCNPNQRHRDMLRSHPGTARRTPQPILPGQCQDICREFRQVPTSIVQNRPIGIIPVVDSWCKHRRMASSSWIFVLTRLPGDYRKAACCAAYQLAHVPQCSVPLGGTKLIISDMSLNFAPFEV